MNKPFFLRFIKKWLSWKTIQMLLLNLTFRIEKLFRFNNKLDFFIIKCYDYKVISYK